MEKHGAIYEVRRDALKALLLGGRVLTYFPPDVEIVGFVDDERNNRMGIKVFHHSLPLVREGEPYEWRRIEVK